MTRASPEQTYMNNWPEALWKLTLPGYKAIEIDAATVRALVACAYGDTEGKDLLPILKARIEAEMENRPWFIRLNSRSPKDYRNPPITMDPQEAIDFLTISMRTVSDLEQMMVYGTPCVIYLRRPVTMDPGTEFRCFVKGRKAYRHYSIRWRTIRLPGRGEGAHHIRSFGVRTPRDRRFPLFRICF